MARPGPSIPQPRGYHDKRPVPRSCTRYERAAAAIDALFGLALAALALRLMIGG